MPVHAADGSAEEAEEKAKCTRLCPGCRGGGRSCAHGMPDRSDSTYRGLAMMAADVGAARHEFMAGSPVAGEEVAVRLPEKAWTRAQALEWYSNGALILAPSGKKGAAATPVVVRDLTTIRRVPPPLTSAEYLAAAHRLGIFGETALKEIKFELRRMSDELKISDNYMTWAAALR